MTKIYCINRLSEEILKISAGDVKATVEMVRQIIWGAALEGKELSLQTGLQFMRHSFYPKVCTVHLIIIITYPFVKEVQTVERACSITLQDENSSPELGRKKMKLSKLIGEMVCVFIP
jgi:hypothetical protein